MRKEPEQPLRIRQPGLRIPPAQPRGLTGRLLGRLVTAWSRHRYGDTLDLGYVLWHHRPVLMADLAWERRVERWDELDADLKNLAVLAAAAAIGCSWCVDFGYFAAHSAGHSVARLSEVPRWRESDAFTEVERAVLGYAEAMTVTPPEVSDEQVAYLSEELGVPAVVELTMMVAVENQRSRFNAAMGLRSQGFSDRCAT